MSEKYPLPDVRGKRVVLLLQGGGALGAYQVGAFEALAAHLERHGKKRIDWVAGISIGAINAAVIAGNASEDLLPSFRPEELRTAAAGQPGTAPPLSKLEQLWKNITWPGPAAPVASSNLPYWREWNERRALLTRYAGFDWAATWGQQHFFSPRLLTPWTNPWATQWWRNALAPEELGNYDTSPLRTTLADPGQINWDLINIAAGDRTRLSLGATSVATGETVFFDSNVHHLGPEHVLASGALPPAFPPVKAALTAKAHKSGKTGKTDKKEEYYFDGGISSNTPLLDLEDELSTEPTIVFDIHVWDRQGEIPRTMDELAWRQKSIQYGSRKRIAELIVDRHQHRPVSGEKPVLIVYQVMYESSPEAKGDPGDSSFALSDADFSPASIELRRALGRKDMHDALLFPELVKSVGGDRAALYRYGTYGKHIVTDRKIAARSADAGASAAEPKKRTVANAAAETGHVAAEGIERGADAASIPPR